MPSILNATTSSGLVTSADNSGSLQLATNNGTTAVTIDTSQNVGIGITTPQQTLHVNNASSPRIKLTNATTGTGASDGSEIAIFDADNSLRINNLESANILFGTGGSERMRIDNTGDLLIGTTNESVTSGVGYKFRVDAAAPYFHTVGSSSSNSDATFALYSTGAGAYRFYVTYGGTIFATSTSISAISDSRLKENVRPLDLGLSEVMALQPRRFDWKEGKGQDKKDAVGFIAQEFETVLPNSVGTSKAGEDGVEYKNINYEELVPTLVKAIQELNAKVDAQALEIQALKGVA